MSPTDDPRDRFKRPLERPGLTPTPAPPSQRNALVPAGPVKDEAPAPGGLARLLDAVAKMLSPKPATPAQAQQQPTATPAAEPPVFTVLVAAVNGDSADGAASQALFKLLETRPALKVRPFPRPFQLDTLEDPQLLAALLSATRHALADENADLLVWGDFAKDGYRLRLAGPGLPDDERPGSFGPTTRIELPVNLGEPQLNLLYAAILAAAEPATEVQRAAMRRLLPPAAQALEPLAAKPPVSLSMAQQRSIQLVNAHVAVACALAVPPSQAESWFQKAIDGYKAAEKRLGRNEAPWEAGLLARHLGAAWAARAERSKEHARSHWEEAVKHWRTAAETLARATMPLDWAATQARLGVALYRLDLLTGDTELLREALTALQAAMQVHTRAEAPHRWAEIMHNVAQVLEVYGDQLKNPDVLKRAVDACHSVLEVRSRERTPLAWAAASNTLGSALFLLDKHGGGLGHLEEAVLVLEEALQIFQAHGAKGPAQVAARNLAHVRKLAEDRKGRAVIDPGWR
ncbi:hypothetical protein [Magnetospirillum sp. UT-4]|uniref:hypothetical protein n=1 Tax=Magnetospirillum sp. UT-4 TaxID=2681467 RepID=UPI0013815B34|nr:hypothetical protein [Magnetospirillum sp. UT-4]CAA7626174.1 conserved hypothetical protein [Magnetospirillum sp. UT-4]